MAGASINRVLYYKLLYWNNHILTIIIKKDTNNNDITYNSDTTYNKKKTYSQY